jgi:predicted phage terminase large subunit-like protein
MQVARATDREIVTTKRGKRFATSIDGTLTGLGGNLIVIDDPLKLGDAHSEAVRARSIEWYRSTLLSRGDDKDATRIVLVMQRVHEDDLAGHLQEQGGFEVLNLPAIAKREETYELGGGRIYTRQKGELLHPAHEPAHVLAELRREMGPIAFSAQYQQSPMPPGGTIIKRKWLTTYDQIGSQPRDRIIISWDIALSEMETGDYSACVVLLKRGEVFFVLEVIRGRFPFETLKRKIIEVKDRYHSPTLLIEESPISQGLIQSLQGQWINVTAYKPETDKRARLIAQTDLFAGGSVRLPRRAEWLEEFTAELLAFKKKLSEVMQDAGKEAGFSVQVDDALGSIEREWWGMSAESFYHFGHRIAREVGGVFKIYGKRALLVKRNAGLSASGLGLSSVIARAGGNLINWDISPIVARPRYQSVIARWYDMKAAKWKQEKVEIGGIGDKADNITRFTEADKDEAKHSGNNGKEASDRNKGEGSVVIDGDPGATPEGLCIVIGVRPGIDGAYRIDTVDHELSRDNGFTTTLSLKQPQGSAGTDTR